MDSKYLCGKVNLNLADWDINLYEELYEFIEEKALACVGEAISNGLKENPPYADISPSDTHEPPDLHIDIGLSVLGLDTNIESDAWPVFRVSVRELAMYFLDGEKIPRGGFNPESKAHIIRLIEALRVIANEVELGMESWQRANPPR